MSLIAVHNLTKNFGVVRALDNVCFEIEKGMIHCLCGENGAGKSTLMKIISGVIPFGAYQGDVLYKQSVQKFHTVKDSDRKGIAIIHQELALSPYLSISENIYLGHSHTKFGIIDFFKMSVESQKLLDKVGLDESPQTIVRQLGIGKQQLVEIAKALSKDVELLILDEPTAALNDEESANLLDLVLELKKEGLTCIMISHKLDEVLKIADSITILRDGKTINTYNTKKIVVDEKILIKDMVGREMENRFPKRNSNIGEIIFEIKDWTVFSPDDNQKATIKNINLNVRKGEVVGFCGLMGSGRTELMMSIFGSSYGSHSSGEIYFRGKKCRWRTPKEAISSGLGYVSEDRKELGLIQLQDVKTNITNSNLKGCSTYGIMNNTVVEKKGIEFKKLLNIKTPNVHTNVGNLSGGNQQKVVLSRCLYAAPDILIVDEPTRGIDVGAKYEIYQIINDLVADGKSVIVISSELVEVLGIADRIYVMNEGSIKGELDVKDATQEKIMHIAIGGKNI